MSDNQERFYVMSETEFEAALSAQRQFTVHESGKWENEIRTDELWTELQDAEAACRARKVMRKLMFPEFVIWVEVEK